jgi:NRAMP (natural resistance-associated macrophage protein)-like metal ion transporter
MWQRGSRGARKTLARRRGLIAYLAVIGPGMVAANAGNDAGGIATYSSAGAAYGYRLLWTLIPVTISLGIVQEMCARVGAVTGKGLAELIRERFGVRWAGFLMLALLIANGGVTVSEFVGIAAAAELFAVPRTVSVPLAALFVWLLVVKGSYKRVERVFLIMSLVFLGYIVSAFLAHPAWGEVARETIRPSFSLDAGYLFMVMAVIGTTISPYMQVFVQSSVVDKGVTPEEYPLTRADVWVGTIFSDLIAFFIIVCTAATLFKAGKQVDSAADAAKALEPLASKYAEVLFAIGLFGASMLAAGVLPLATAYSITEALGFEKGVSSTFRQAPIFLGIFTFLIAVAAIVAVIPGLPLIRVLLITQVINTLLLPVILVAALRLAGDRGLMGEHAIGPIYKTLAWLTIVGVSLLSTLYILASLFPGFLGQ